MKPELILLMGRPGSGKSTYYAKNSIHHLYVSQDLYGKQGHKDLFEKGIAARENIIVDRQNHIREQRKYYLDMAKAAGYSTKIIELNTPKDLCEDRILNRKDHPTIDNSANIRSILGSYDAAYQGVLSNEADEHIVVKQKYYATIRDLTWMRGRIAVIGDPHGCFNDVMNAINDIKPDYVVFVGDLIDRGPDVEKMLDYARNNKNVFTVQGNHEAKLKRWLKGNKINVSGGLQETINQLSHYTQEQKDDLFSWISGLPLMIKLPKNYVVVHAGVNPDKPLEKQKYDTCLYIRNHGGNKHDDPKHPKWYEFEPCDELKPYHILFGHSVHADMAYASYWATALDKGAVYGTGLRVSVIDTDGQDSIMEYKTQIHFDSASKPERSPFFKREELVSQRYLTKSEQDNLVLYNYTDATTYARMWIKETIESRGTIYDRNTGLVVAQSFPKFFNIGEHESTRMENLPWDKPFEVFDKADGSLGILYRHEGKLRVSTRGSFYSDQAKKATEMLSKYDFSKLPQNYTLLFEIIYPENHIVVNYGQTEQLMLLAAYDIDLVNISGDISSSELPRSKVEEIANLVGMPLVQSNSFTLDDMLYMKDRIKWNESEGWVVRFQNGTRVKIKGTEYLEMAKILSNMSPLSIWESMMTGKIQEYLESIPEEIRDQADAIYDRLNESLSYLQALADDALKRILMNPIDMKDKVAVKAIAIEIQKTPDWMHSYLFMAMRGKQDRSFLIELIRPKGNVYVDVRDENWKTK